MIRLYFFASKTAHETNDGKNNAEDKKLAPLLRLLSG